MSFPNDTGRRLAPHVQAALAAAQGVGQAKGGLGQGTQTVLPADGRQMAAHVQRALAGAMQAKVQELTGGRGQTAAHQGSVVRVGAQGLVQRASTQTVEIIQRSSWADIVRSKPKKTKSPPKIRTKVTRPRWSKEQLIRDIKTNKDALAAFAQKRRDKEWDRIWFKDKRHPSDGITCTFMWQHGSAWDQFVWGLSGGFLSWNEKSYLGNANMTGHSCGETNVLLRNKSKTFVVSVSYGAWGWKGPCKRCGAVLKKFNIWWEKL